MTFSCNRHQDTCDFQCTYVLFEDIKDINDSIHHVVWVDEIESFYCHLNECAFEQGGVMKKRRIFLILIHCYRIQLWSEYNKLQMQQDRLPMHQGWDALWKEWKHRLGSRWIEWNADYLWVSLTYPSSDLTDLLKDEIKGPASFKCTNEDCAFSGNMVVVVKRL